MHRPHPLRQPVVIVQPLFLIAPFQPGGVVAGGVGGYFLAEQIHRNAEMEVDVFLNGGQIDDAGRPQPLRIVRLQLAHHLGGALRHPHNPAFAHEHMMRLFGEHELAGAGQRVESRLRQRRQLILAVAVGEESEHQIRQPVGGGLVESPQDAGTVDVAGMTRQQQFGLFPPVAPEIGVQQIDHRPQMAPLFHIDLE